MMTTQQMNDDIDTTHFLLFELARFGLEITQLRAFVYFWRINGSISLARIKRPKN